MPVEPNPHDKAHLISERSSQDDPIVQYYIVRKDVEMSVGKLIPQTGHGAMMFMEGWHELEDKILRVFSTQRGGSDYIKYKKTKKWFDESFRKISKVGTAKDFEKVKKEVMVFSVKDAGLTEVPQGTETMLVTWPMRRSETPKVISKLRNAAPHHFEKPKIDKAVLKEIKEALTNYQYERDSGKMDEDTFTDFAYTVIDEYLPELIQALDSDN